MAFVEGGSDLYGIANLDKIVCPDCGKGYMKKLKLQPNKLLCKICDLLIDDAEVMQQITSVPQSGMGIDIHSKPYFQQTGANTKILEQSDSPPFESLDTDSNMTRLNKFTIKGLASGKVGNMQINKKNTRVNKQQGKEEDTLKAVTKLMKNYGTDVKVELF